MIVAGVHPHNPGQYPSVCTECNPIHSVFFTNELTLIGSRDQDRLVRIIAESVTLGKATISEQNVHFQLIIFKLQKA